MREMWQKSIVTLNDLRVELELLYGKRESLASWQHQFCTLRQDAKKKSLRTPPESRPSGLRLGSDPKTCTNEFRKRVRKENSDNRPISKLSRSTGHHHMSHRGWEDDISTPRCVGIQREKTTCGGNAYQSMGAADKTGACYTCGKAGHLEKKFCSERQSLLGAARKEMNVACLTCNYCKKNKTFMERFYIT